MYRAETFIVGVISFVWWYGEANTATTTTTKINVNTSCSEGDADKCFTTTTTIAAKFVIKFVCRSTVLLVGRIHGALCGACIAYMSQTFHVESERVELGPECVDG